MSKKVLHAFVTLPANLTFTVKIFFELIPHSFHMVGWIVAMPQHCQRQQVFGGSTIISPGIWNNFTGGRIDGVNNTRWNINIF